MYEEFIKATSSSFLQKISQRKRILFLYPAMVIHRWQRERHSCMRKNMLHLYCQVENTVFLQADLAEY